MVLSTLLVITGSTLLSVLIWLIVAGVIFWLITWAISYVGVPEPFNKIIRVVLALIVLIILINALLSIAGHPWIVW